MTGTGLVLKDPSLLREANLVGEAWIPAAERPSIEVRNKANGERLGEAPALSRADVRRAVECAHEAGKTWARRTAKERSRLLRRLYDLMTENAEDLARILTAEQGKPLAEARAEIAYAAGFVEWFAEEAKRIYGDIIPENIGGRRILVQKEPIGVFAAITPWNFPLAMITRKAAPGWAAGCAGIIRPARETPFSALALGVLAERAGFPPGVCNIVTGTHDQTADELCENPLVRKLSFTGSTRVGALLLQKCAPTIKKTSMELGGNAPFIVFDDADLDAAVAGAMVAKFRNTGQTCVCPNRFLVQSGVYEAFADRLCKAVAGLRVGPGDEEAVTQGPLISEAALEKVEAHIADAVSRGARVVLGGRRLAGPGWFFSPTVLMDVAPEARLFHEETFGPVAPLVRFATEEEAIGLANDSEFGLAAYAYTRDVGRVFRLARSLEAGIVGINEGAVSTEVAPFGGIKASGFGREGSKYGIEDYLELKYVCIGGIEA
jgi:succinate-semialdehyde dehydrogenase/glutarate-semialdehyde dehydrogenase